MRIDSVHASITNEHVTDAWLRAAPLVERRTRQDRVLSNSEDMRRRSIDTEIDQVSEDHDRN